MKGDESLRKWKECKEIKREREIENRERNTIKPRFFSVTRVVNSRTQTNQTQPNQSTNDTYHCQFLHLTVSTQTKANHPIHTIVIHSQKGVAQVFSGPSEKARARRAVGASFCPLAPGKTPKLRHQGLSHQGGLLPAWLGVCCDRHNHYPPPRSMIILLTEV